ncbi:hypothetical protein M427DRAFT_44609 [Gonapodya prolifera JEL478]|uniref:Uncharacterized protein n=1 Tax=Gonapodya prolifera (strain JEL478) TaxID=1344416 RepID=A0A139AF06_GONPJ|nr:hypothetical protein M427DRAFT_44609 [Gonapodya prolifera JEL478]|eukprot:KXS15338.1 hypothetical protein M427DRAFT_44609 [Gonapodya prolifera JEL478]
MDQLVNDAKRNKPKYPQGEWPRGGIWSEPLLNAFWGPGQLERLWPRGGEHESDLWIFGPLLAYCYVLVNFFWGKLGRAQVFNDKWVIGALVAIREPKLEALSKVVYIGSVWVITKEVKEFLEFDGTGSNMEDIRIYGEGKVFSVAVPDMRIGFVLYCIGGKATAGAFISASATIPVKANLQRFVICIGRARLYQSTCLLLLDCKVLGKADWIRVKDVGGAIGGNSLPSFHIICVNPGPLGPATDQVANVAGILVKDPIMVVFQEYLAYCPSVFCKSHDPEVVQGDAGFQAAL